MCPGVADVQDTRSRRRVKPLLCFSQYLAVQLVAHERLGLINWQPTDLINLIVGYELTTGDLTGPVVDHLGGVFHRVDGLANELAKPHVIASFLFDFAYCGGDEGLAGVKLALGQRPIVIMRTVDARHLQRVGAISIPAPHHGTSSQGGAGKLLVRFERDFLMTASDKHLPSVIFVLLVQVGGARSVSRHRFHCCALAARLHCAPAGSHSVAHPTRTNVSVSNAFLSNTVVGGWLLMVNVAVMGAGSWGTTLAKVFADGGNSVSLWARRTELAQTISQTHENPDYLPGIRLPEAISAVDDAPAALSSADIVVFAVPSQTMRQNLTEWAPHLRPDSTLVSISKGIEAKTHMRMSEIIAEVTGAPNERIAVLSGPNLAREIALEQPAATVIACENENRAKLVQAACATNYLRPYTNTDVIGCEIGGATKNVIALACGMAAGQGLGENTIATLITRGLAEITRLGLSLGADQRTFSGLAGLGDLVATCSSPLSRNRTFGHALGQGATIEEAKAATKGQVAEGVASSRSIFQLGQAQGVDLPITQAVHAVCHGDLKVAEVIAALMGRSKKSE